MIHSDGADSAGEAPDGEGGHPDGPPMGESFGESVDPGPGQAPGSDEPTDAPLTGEVGSDWSDLATAPGEPADREPPDSGAEEDSPTDGSADPEATVEAQRDEYLERLQRLQAEFENYRKRMTREQAQAHERGAQNLADQLLPVLDGCEAALKQGHDDVEPIHSQLMELLTKAGLERNGQPGDPFDPELHEAVMHEPAVDDDDGVSAIAEVLRTGYSWKGRVLRPAMVKVRG